LSSGYFSRAFKRESGFSPHQWLMKRRVVRAKGLLREPRLKLAEIAQICGFADQSHFTRVFRKVRIAARGTGGVSIAVSP
jgi:AraC-like DNA-binding protein